MTTASLIKSTGSQIIEITVHNKLDFNGTTVHWHGLRQFQTSHMDGVNAVSQCPIAPGDSFTYKFTAMQYGTSWYHSHYSLQYGDGLLGPLTIHGPSTKEYDEGRDPILFTDWNHRSGFMEYVHELNPPPGPMESILLNGHGMYRWTFTIAQYSDHRLGSYAGGGNCGYKYNTTFERVSNLSSIGCSSPTNFFRVKNIFCG